VNSPEKVTAEEIQQFKDLLTIKKELENEVDELKKIALASLYPDILFHFTTHDGLLNILKETFKVSYARERVQGIATDREFAVPMVSFCDLKLSELKLHMKKYGKCGIGLTKEWANRKGLNPVMYVNRHSPFTDNFNDSLNGVYRKLNTLTENNHFKGISKNNLKIFDTYRFIKNYEATLERKEVTIENFRFADEREWRYVPPINQEGIPPFVAKSRIDTQAKKEFFNKLSENVKLDFEPSDIKYIIIENDSQISHLISHLRKVKNRYSDETLETLSSRILTADQIYSDM
jgi:hypothetical protein